VLTARLGEGTLGDEAEIPLQPVEETTAEQRFPYSPLSGDGYAGADIHTAAAEGPHTRAAGCFLKELQPMERPRWSRGDA